MFAQQEVKRLRSELARLTTGLKDHDESRRLKNQLEECVTAAEGKSPSRRGRVLIIDDEPGILRALRRLLKDHDVVEAESGGQALDLLSKDQRFDVILCDVMMRPISGMDVHRWLLAHHPRLAERVVFLTGGAFTPHAREYLATVDNLRIEKPFDGTKLMGLITERVLAVRTNE